MKRAFGEINIFKNNQTLVEWSLDDPFPNLCPVIPTSNQNDCQANNRKKGNDINKNASSETTYWLWGPSWSKGQTVEHIFGREPSNDYFINI
jgi:hypothetical protein